MRTRNTETPKSGGPKKTPPAKKDAAPAASDKKPPPAAAAAAAAAAKSTPKSASGAKVAKGTAKQSIPKAAAAAGAATATATAAVTPDPKAESKAEEVVTPSADPKPVSAAKLPEKKLAGRTKSPLSSSTRAAEEAKEKPVKPEEKENPAAPKKGMEQEKPAAPKKGEDQETPAAFEKGEEAGKDEVKIEKADPMAVPEAKNEIEDSPVKMEEESDEKEGIDHMMEEHAEQEGFQEPGDEELSEEGEEEDGGEEAGGEEQVGGLEEEERIEMSDMIKERKMKRAQEIFVGGLDRDATEEDVSKAFEKIGVVEEVRLHKDFATNKNKGFAFVKFADKEQATRALSELKNPVIRGKRCGIAPSEDNDTLFLGNICNTWTKEAIKRRLKEYGVEGVESITLVGDTQQEGLSRGFAFVEFSCHEYAMNAYKRLQKPDVVFGHAERTAKVAFAEPLREPDAEVMAQVKSVFVDGLPPYWDEDRVKEQFKGYGEIERVVLARNMPTARRKDFGFVNFTSHEAAIACIEGVNNTELGDGKSKMKVRARLANPLPKTQAVKDGMRGGFRIGHSGLGVYSGFGRGFGRGRLPFTRAGFQGGRGFHLHGRGRGGRFSFATYSNMESSRSEFRGRRPFGVRGGRRGYFRGAYQGFGDEFAPQPSSSARPDVVRSGRGAFGGHGRPFHSRREPFTLEGDFGGPFDGGHFGEDPYIYGDIGHGIKRPFSMMEHDSSYLEPGARLRTHYDHADPLSGGDHYRDSLRSAGGRYSHGYYGSDYGGSEYSSLYGGERSGGGYYY